MITARRSNERGHADHGWLDTYHTFSFADYVDPRFMGFGALRVLNDDRVAPGTGFPSHPHRDMEIVTLVLDGALEHRDSMGNGSVIRPGDVQRMSAGTGVVHSEVNPSRDAPVHLLQIWIVPARKGLAPGYAQRSFAADGVRNRFRRVIRPHDDPRDDGSLTVVQDAHFHLARLDLGAATSLPLAPGRRAWLHVARGRVDVNGASHEGGDGAAVQDEPVLTVRAHEDADVLVIELA